MNRFLFFAFLAFSLCIRPTADGKELRPEQVPSTVRNSFNQKYPDTKPYEWEWKKKNHQYRAKFVIDGKKYKAYFQDSGPWLRTKRSLKKWEIPQAVRNAVDGSEYRNWEIDDVDELSTPQYQLVYEVEVEQGKREVHLFILPDGKIVDTKIKK